MSGNKKFPEPVQSPTQVTSSRPTDVSFPSVKDLKNKFSITTETIQKETANNREKKIRQSWAQGNTNVKISGLDFSASDKSSPQKTPTTPTINIPKSFSTVLTTPTTNGFSKQNGTSSGATTPTTPTASFQRSSVILHVKAGERRSTEIDGVEIRKKSDFEGSGSDTVKRITSQFNGLGNQTTTYTKTTPEPAIRKLAVEEFAYNKVEEIRSEVKEETYLIAKEELREDLQQSFEPDNNNLIANDDEDSRRMSTPSADFLQSMNNNNAEHEEFEFKDNTEHNIYNEHKEPDLEEHYEANGLNDAHNEEPRYDSFSNNFEGFQSVDSALETEHHHDEDETNHYTEINEVLTPSHHHENRIDDDSAELSDHEINVRLDAIEDSDKTAEEEIRENIIEHIEERIEDSIEEKLEERIEEKLEERIEEKLEERIEEKIEEIVENNIEEQLEN